MQEIKRIYHNEVGIGFYWKKEADLLDKKVQLVFRDTGFYLTINQLEQFKLQIAHSLKTYCSQCPYANECRSILLKSPCNFIDFAVTRKELYAIDDLIKGVLFQIKMNRLIQEVCPN